MFDLPLHTPNAAIIFSFGTIYTKQRIDQKQLIYLHKILSKNDDQWTKKTLRALEELDIGWARAIKSTLIDYSLPTEFSTIKSIHPTVWRNTIRREIDKKNLERLLSDCHKKVDGTLSAKTKTKSLVDKLKDPNYKRKTQNELNNATKQETKTIVTARYGMLECGNNYRGTLNRICNQCDDLDDEDHRLNYCAKWRNVNLYDSTEKTDFTLIHSNDINVLRPIISKIEMVWNTKNGHGTMNIR